MSANHTFRATAAARILAAILGFLPGAWCSTASAQAPAKVPKIGVALPFPQGALDAKQAPVQAPFEDGLRGLGWVSGVNVEVIYRSTLGPGGDEKAVRELLQTPVDVLVPFGMSAHAAIRATTSVPIVIALTGALGQGAVSSLSRPGGNVTGISIEEQGALVGKRLSLLKDVGSIRRVARIYFGTSSLRIGSLEEILPDYATSAKALGLEIFPVFLSTPDDLRAAFADFARQGRVGISTYGYGRVPGREALWDTLMELVERHRIPAVFDTGLAVDSGGLMSVGTDFRENARRRAYFVDRILRGAKPSDLPIEQPTRYELVLNLRAAKSIGLTFPPPVLLQAGRVVR